MAKYGSSGTPWTSGTVLDLAGYDTSSKSTLVKSESGLLFYGSPSMVGHK